MKNKTGKQYMAVLVALLILVACRSVKPINTTNKTAIGQSSSSFEQSSAWTKIMANASPQINVVFGNLISVYSKNFQEKDITLTANDMASLKFVPIPVYQVDSAVLRSFNERSSLSSTLKLSTTRGTFAVYKGDSIVAEFFAGYKDGKWFNQAGLAIPDVAERSYVEKLLKAHKPYYEVYVVGFPSSHNKMFQEYMITQENDECIVALNWDHTFTLKKALIGLSKQFNETITKMHGK